MNIKKVLFYILIIILVILLLNFISLTSLEISSKNHRGETEGIRLLHIYQVFYGFFIGIFVRATDILRIITKEKLLKINYCLIPGIILFLISLVPPDLALQVNSLTYPFPSGPIGRNILTAPLVWGPTQNILSVIAGIITIDGLTGDFEQLK